MFCVNKHTSAAHSDFLKEYSFVLLFRKILAKNEIYDTILF